jgi:hypothetical protein
VSMGNEDGHGIREVRIWETGDWETERYERFGPSELKFFLICGYLILASGKILNTSKDQA